VATRNPMHPRAQDAAVPVVHPRPFEWLHEDFRELVRELFGAEDLWPLWPRRRLEGTFVPRVDVHETESEVRVFADLPGLEQKDFQVELTDEGLIIRGERRCGSEEERNAYCRAERPCGSFERLIPLPCPVDADNVDATLRNGVLTIVLPRPPEVQPGRKRIKVKSG